MFAALLPNGFVRRWASSDEVDGTKTATGILYDRIVPEIWIVFDRLAELLCGKHANYSTGPINGRFDIGSLLTNINTKSKKDPTESATTTPTTTTTTA